MKYGITAGLPDLPAGLPDKEFNAIAPVYRAIHTVAQQTARQTNAVQYDPGELAQIDPLVGVKTDRNNRIVIKAGEALNYGHLIYLTTAGPNYVAYKADNNATTGHKAVACVSSAGGIASGAFGEAVFMTGLCTGVSGTVAGTQYYLGAAGTASSSYTPGTIHQQVGVGLGTPGLYLTIADGTGGGVAPVTSVTSTVANFTLTNATAATQFFSSTASGNWNSGAGAMTVQFDVVPTNYFTANPNGHFAVVLRQEAAIVGSDPAGQGIAVGNATGYPGGASDLNPTPLLETFGKGTLPVTGLDNYLWSYSESARKYPIADGGTYRFIVQSVVDANSNRWLRYRMWKKNTGTNAWDAHVDTGHVLDHNTTFDPTNTGLLFGHVFPGAGVWSLAFSNISITWGPVYDLVPDTTVKLSRFGGIVDGPLTLGGATAAVNSTIDSYDNMTAWGGTEAKAFADATVLDIDDICTIGTISSFLSSPPTSGEVENVLRPLYCIVSVLIANMYAKKLI